MHPILFQHGDFVVGAYGPVYLAAFLVSIATFALLARRFAPYDFWTFVDVGFQAAIAGEIGARVAFVIVEWERFFAGEIGPREFLLAGRVVLGGVIAGGLWGAWVFRRHRLPVASMLDCIFAAAALGMGIGRIACLLAGCCFGRPTDLAWGITFHDPLARQISGTPLGVPLHPTQPLLAVLAILTFVVVAWIVVRGRTPGLASVTFLVLSGATRFGVEFLRGDPRGAGAGLATSQWIGLAMVLIGAVAAAFLLRRRQDRRPVDVAV